MKTEKPIPLSPFHCPIPLRRLTRPEFDELSRLFMAQVFASQNELGRLCDEVVYQNDIALRLEAAGLGPVAKEVPVTVTWRDFTKTHLRRFLALTPLATLHWVNLHHHELQLVTITR